MSMAEHMIGLAADEIVQATWRRRAVRMEGLVREGADVGAACLRVSSCEIVHDDPV